MECFWWVRWNDVIKTIRSVWYLSQEEVYCKHLSLVSKDTIFTFCTTFFFVYYKTVCMNFWDSKVVDPSFMHILWWCIIILIFTLNISLDTLIISSTIFFCNHSTCYTLHRLLCYACINNYCYHPYLTILNLSHFSFLHESNITFNHYWYISIGININIK